MSNELDTSKFEQGVNTVDESSQAYQDELADVKAWFEKINQARTFDEAQRKQYAMDRCYARGDSGDYEVVVEIAQSNIEVLRSFLYAKDPDLNIQPSASTEPPPQKELEKQARDEQKVGKQQQAEQAAQIGSQMGPMLGQIVESGALPQLIQQVGGALQGGDMEGGAEDGSGDEAEVQAIAKTKGAPYQERRQDAKQIAGTAEITVAHLWRQADLKAKAKLLVGSALTIGIAWLKANWQERRGPNPDPLIHSQLADAQDNLLRINEAQQDLASGECADEEATRAELQQQIAHLESQVEVLLARGLAIDFVPAEDVQVSTDIATMAQYKDADWIAQRSFIPKEEAEAMFPELADKEGDYIKAAATYHAKKPKDPTETRDTGWIAGENMTASDADTYQKGGGDGKAKGSVLVWEVWSKTTGNVITLMEGVKCYARKPYVPQPATTRFYPFFQFAIGHVDGERHPRSLIARSCTLFDEYCQARSSWKRARSRAIGKLVFDKTGLESADVTAIEQGTEQEMIGVSPVIPGTKVSEMIAPVQYARIDPALFDTGPIRAEIETIWAVQEALSSSIHTAKTATEAEIQQTGTNARGGYMRDGLDELLTELAVYTTEVAVQKLTHEDVVEIAGPWALWPEGITAQDLPTLVNIDIRAGSTGKPNTAKRQEVWATTVPILQNAIMQIGQMRGSTPTEIADCLEELVKETLDRTGERIDSDRFLPDPPVEGTQAPKPPPPPPAEASMQGQQISAMTTVLDQTRQGILSPQTAQALLQACFPTVDPKLIEQMVQGVSAAAPAVPSDAPANGMDQPPPTAMPAPAAVQ